jgi:hypothetical protein
MLTNLFMPFILLEHRFLYTFCSFGGSDDILRILKASKNVQSTLRKTVRSNITHSMCMYVLICMAYLSSF